jgi:PEGA domain
MTPTRIFTAVSVAALLVSMPSVAGAQVRSRVVPGRAVVRTGPPPRVVRPGVRVVPYRTYPYYYYPYRSTLSLGFGYYGYPGFYAPYYRYPYPVYGYGGYGNGYGYGYGYGQSYGGVRIDLPQKDAEVYADGYFVGNVDSFDGPLQQLNLEPGPHRIEVRAAGFQTVNFEVYVEPGRTITYRAALRPAVP